MGQRWYVAQTKPKAEKRACHWLGMKDIDVFVPKMEIKKRRKLGVVLAIEPVFPGYLFVKLEPSPSSWQQLKWTPGIKKVLGFNGAPSVVPEEVISELQKRTRQKGFIQEGSRFRKGEKVLVTQGPLKGLVGVIEEARPGKERINILMNILSSPTRVQTNASELQKVS
jgi:transcriptional antiterminator RfaH